MASYDIVEAPGPAPEERVDTFAIWHRSGTYILTRVLGPTSGGGRDAAMSYC